jgi:glyoxylase-like metal-dependent hydrolase (beta-lactamase superfamily II)
MAKTRIADNILCYNFPFPGQPRVDVNVFVLVNGKRAIIIDPSFKPCFQEVSADLASGGVTVSNVIVSHFHADHCESVPDVPGADVWGASNYRDSLTELPPEEVRGYVVTKPVSFDRLYSIEGFSVMFHCGAGHAPCGILTIIENRYVQVNDLINTNHAGTPITPLIMDKIDSFRGSLLFLKDRAETLLMPHGSYGSRVEAQMDIEMRLRYLDRLEREGRRMRIDDFEAENGINLDYKEFHESNVARFF